MKEPIILGFYGSSNSGKTTIIFELISWLTSQGFHVASVKKTKKPFQLDTPGKDTFLHGQAGAKPVVLSTKNETSFIVHHHFSEKQIIDKIESFYNVDVVFIEGCAEDHIKKIKMDEKKTTRKNTIYTYENDCEKIKKYLILELKRRKKEMNYKTTLKVNGKIISLTEFPDEFIQNTLLGMISSLKGVNAVETVELVLEPIE